jgi:hypothetical protein
MGSSKFDEILVLIEEIYNVEWIPQYKEQELLIVQIQQG